MMKLIFLLFGAFVLLSISEGKTYLTQLTVHSPHNECEPGWKKYTRICDKGSRVWHVNVHSSVTTTRVRFYDDKSVEECIDLCNDDPNCLAVSMEGFGKQTCNLFQKNYKIKLEIGWTTVEIVCCRIIKPRSILTDPGLILPIIFNPSTNCNPESRVMTCDVTEKVWHIEEGRNFLSSYVRFPNFPRLYCMNKCIKDSKCASIDESADDQDACYLNVATQNKADNKHYSTFILKCCKLKKPTQWHDNYRNLPIIYDFKYQCDKHELLNRAEKCELKVWEAIAGAAVDIYFHQIDDIEEVVIGECLNTCLNFRYCAAVTIRPRACRLHLKGTISNYTFGHRMTVLYRLTCCTLGD